MISFIKNNKLLSLMISITVLIFIIGIISSFILNEDTKKMILDNIKNIILNIKDNNLSNLKNFFKCFSNNLIYCFIIWVFGISIIGLPIIILLYGIKVYLFTIEIIYLFINIKSTGILFNIIYIIPDVISIFILFLITYYSISYSIILFRILFRKKNYLIHKITKKYVKIFFISYFIYFLSSLVEIFVLPKILFYLV